MDVTATHLFDTSILIAQERGEGFDQLANSWATAAITLAELNLGALLATTPTARQRSLSMLRNLAERPVIEFDETTARTYAELVAWASTVGVRPSTADAMIAATAATNGLTLVTLDKGFDRLAGFDGLDIAFP